MNRRELRGRLLWMDEALADGDTGTAHAVLLDLLDELPAPAPARCPECGLPFDAPGLVARHLDIVHPGRAA